jgi:hypothetical protein
LGDIPVFDGLNHPGDKIKWKNYLYIFCN